METNKPYEFSRGLELGQKKWQPKPMVRYSVPNRPVNKIIKQEAEVEPEKDEPIRPSAIFDELDDEDVLDEIPQAVKLSAKEQKEIEAEPEPEPEPEPFDPAEEDYTEDEEDV